MSKREKLLREKYQKEIDYYHKHHKCPACGSPIDRWNQIRMRGWRFGVECDDCR